jgi:glycosyltransferase involved in cell wall biosynthesis
MHWLMLSLSNGAGGTWLERFLPSTTRHRLEIHPCSWTTDDQSKRTGASLWVKIFRHAFASLRGTRHATHAGVITCFPQLTLAVAVVMRLTEFRRRPLVAWHFNLGKAPGTLARRIAGLAYRRVDTFVVHSTLEARAYPDWFGLPPERFVFVPLQAQGRSFDLDEDRVAPFIVAMGSAVRDYATLVEAVRGLAYPLVIIAADHAVEHIAMPPHVRVVSGITIEACYGYLQRARLSVIPISNLESASGQSTLIDSLAYGKATIATRCPGTVDYVDDGVDAILVPPKDVTAMRAAIERLWNDDAARARMGRAAITKVEAAFCDQAIARHLERILDAFVPAGEARAAR